MEAGSWVPFAAVAMDSLSPASCASTVVVVVVVVVVVAVAAAAVVVRAVVVTSFATSGGFVVAEGGSAVLRSRDLPLGRSPSTSTDGERCFR